MRRTTLVSLFAAAIFSLGVAHWVASPGHAQQGKNEPDAIEREGERRVDPIEDPAAAPAEAPSIKVQPRRPVPPRPEPVEQPGDAPATELAPGRTEDSPDAITRQRLARRIEANYQDLPLGEFLNALSDQLDIDILAQWRDLENNAAVSLDAPISLRLRSVRADMLLDLVLQQVSPDAGYVIRDGIVIVASKSSLEEKRVVKVYNARVLLDQISPPPRSELPGSGFGAPASRPQDDLTAMLRTTISPESWDVNGGRGTISEVGGLLVIGQSEEIHGEIEKLMISLHEAASRR